MFIKFMFKLFGGLHTHIHVATSTHFLGTYVKGVFRSFWCKFLEENFTISEH